MGNGSGVSPGDRNRNARLARLRELVPVTNAIAGIDLADNKQIGVVTGHDSKVFAGKTFRCRAWILVRRRTGRPSEPRRRAALLRRAGGRVGQTRLVIAEPVSISAAPAGYRFPREVIGDAVRWYLRYGLSCRDIEELLPERGIEVDHVTIYRWVQTFTPEFIDRARPSRHATGDDRWFVDEVRHEAPWIRVGVRDLRRRAVAAGRLKLGAA